MSEEFRSRLDPTARLLGASGSTAEAQLEPLPGDAEEHADGTLDAFSVVSADRRHKSMLEFRFKNGNAKALAYSYLVSMEFNPSEAIVMDFSGYEVRISGRNLHPLFAGLVAQRVAVVSEMDSLQAEATLAKDATVVTGIEVKER